MMLFCILPINSISQMLEIINDENMIYSCSTEQLKEILYTLQNEDLTKVYDSTGNSILQSRPSYIDSLIENCDMERIIRLEELIIDELKVRGVYTPKKRFSNRRHED